MGRSCKTRCRQSRGRAEDPVVDHEVAEVVRRNVCQIRPGIDPVADRPIKEQAIGPLEVGRQADGILINEVRRDVLTQAANLVGQQVVHDISEQVGGSTPRGCSSIGGIQPGADAIAQPHVQLIDAVQRITGAHRKAHHREWIGGCSGVVEVRVAD